MPRPKRSLHTLAGFQIGKAARQVKWDLSLTQCHRPKRDEELVDGFDVPDAERASYRLEDGFGEPCSIDPVLDRIGVETQSIRLSKGTGLSNRPWLRTRLLLNFDNLIVILGEPNHLPPFAGNQSRTHQAGWIDARDAHVRAAEPLSAADHEQHPVGRVGTVEDVAAMVAWLLSRQAGVVTVQEFVVDGGMSKKMIYSE